ncbi:MAG: hypothetical protein M5R36_17120 [Deltaproteobacteria bacterium]|nr:hypothetical protein [Deltaproteobacteria bacterium]
MRLPGPPDRRPRALRSGVSQTQGAGALAVEAGDTFYPPPRFRKETPEKQKEWAAFIRETMAGLSYDAFVPGEMELEDGLDAFIEYARGAHLPVTVANMVDAETGDPIFETSRIVTNGNGVRVAFVGIAGPAAFAGVTANADFSADVWREDHRARVSDKPKALVKKVGKLLEKTQSEDADEKTKEQLAGLLAAFGDPEAEEAPAALDPPAYEGRRFRLTDPLEAATAERQKLEGRADLYVLVTHLKKNESRTFQSKIKGYQFQIDSHADLKPRALQSAEKGAPFAIRTGNKGKTMGLLTVHLAGGGWEFEDRTLAQRKTKALERYGKQYERLRAEAGAIRWKSTVRTTAGTNAPNASKNGSRNFRGKSVIAREQAISCSIAWSWIKNAERRRAFETYGRTLAAVGAIGSRPS